MVCIKKYNHFRKKESLWKVKIIEFLISLCKPLVWIWNKLSQKFKESSLYSLYKQAAFSHEIYKKTKKLYLLKKKIMIGLQRTDEFECLFRKFCVDIIDFKNSDNKYEIINGEMKVKYANSNPSHVDVSTSACGYSDINTIVGNNFAITANAASSISSSLSSLKLGK